MDSKSPPLRPDFLKGGGEMGALIGALDWSKTSLGPLSGWPQCLKTAVSLMLPAQAQIVLFWGPEFAALYNDAYALTMGDKHPRALGRPAQENWAELWDDLESLLQSVLRMGKTVFAKDRHFYLERYGYPEDVYFDISYSAVRDEGGTVAGVLCIVSETTERILAQRALAKSQERLSYALNASGMVGTFDWHIQSDTFYSDPRFAAMFSVDPAKAEEGAPLSDYLAGIFPDDRDRIAKAINHTIATGERYAQEYRLLQRDGTVRWVEARGECLYDKEGKPLRFPGAVVDITARKLAEVALRKSEARFRKLADNAPVMVWVTEPDASCTNLSRSWYEFTGQTLETGLGFGWLDAVHPDDRVWSDEVFLAANTKREAFRLEYRLRRADGEYRWAIDAAAPRFGADGTFLGYVGSVIDITERKQAEDALRGSEEKLRALFEQTTGGIAQVDTTGCFLLVNRRYCDIVGYTEAELLGMRMQDITHPEDLPNNAILFQQMIEAGTSFVIEKRYVRKDGSLVWVNNSVAPIRDAAGRVQQVVAMVIDITERRRAERLQRVLMHELNHRVKNVLATVQAIAQQTFRSGHGDDAARIAFEARLLALSKAHDLLTRENWDSAELSEVVVEALAHYRRECFEIDGPHVRLTPKVALALSLALHELATNAAKYGALSVPTGRIAVTWTMNSDDPPYLTFRWQERGGPVVSPPTRMGFGSRLIERSLAQELRGEVRIIYDPAGVICDVNAPLADEGETAVEKAA
ncbi:PAS domain S-box protein [Microvirga massiliensis]|uniref:PAS domain S-box protein n=1 Tax=Microvirga massiliensis TaxID=1033741 RepID=UPI00062B4CA6|nr:PAS domain S-box protein [Microvirga massiliensis]